MGWKELPKEEGRRGIGLEDENVGRQEGRQKSERPESPTACGPTVWQPTRSPPCATSCSQCVTRSGEASSPNITRASQEQGSPLVPPPYVGGSCQL
jgi:hypothetical protein